MEVDISGAKVFFTIPIDFPLFGKIQISETFCRSSQRRSVWRAVTLETSFPALLSMP